MAEPRSSNHALVTAIEDYQRGILRVRDYFSLEVDPSENLVLLALWETLRSRSDVQLTDLTVRQRGFLQAEPRFSSRLTHVRASGPQLLMSNPRILLASTPNVDPNPFMRSRRAARPPAPAKL